MLELTKEPTIGGYVDLRLRVPAAQAQEIADKLRTFLDLVNLVVQDRDEEEKETYTLAEVFPDQHQGSAIRGLRYREGLTQKRLAELVGIHPSHISEMERGKRPIGKAMAKRLAKALGSTYKVFL